MVNLKNTGQEILMEFHFDAMLWKSMIGYMENEIQFINRLLNSQAFKETTPNLFERLQEIKHEMKTKTGKVKSFNKEIDKYEIELKGILECQDISRDTFSVESHKSLKNRFEEFYTEFNEYKTKVFDFTGGILR